MKQHLNILLFEDDPDFISYFESILSQYGKLEIASDLSQADELIQNNSYDISFIDIHISGKPDGFQLLESLDDSNSLKVMLTGSKDSLSVEKAFELGADEYLVKTDSGAVLKSQIANLIQNLQNKLILASEEKAINIGQNFLNEVETTCKDFFQSLKFLSKNLNSSVPILLTGPTGVGKTHLANLIHHHSGVKGNFASLNCSSIPKELFESEMFGHKKGAFSGATSDYEGKFTHANDGTVYLDEVDSLPINQQTKLLKVLEEKKFTPVGSNKTKESSFQIVCSSQTNLMSLIQQGKFREDLYYRISLLKLNIPALKERPGDILLYLQKFVESGNRRFYFSKEAKDLIQNHSWPGNIREISAFAKNLELLHKSKISITDVKQIIGTDIYGQSNLLTERQINYIKQHGANALIKEIKKEIVEKFFELNEMKTRKTIKDLGVSQATFYEWRKL
jgi:DNA-binding NtrC family response regulator